MNRQNKQSKLLLSAVDRSNRAIRVDRDQRKARKMYEKLLKKSQSPFKPPSDVRFQRDPKNRNQWFFWTGNNIDRKDRQGMVKSRHGHFGEEANRTDMGKYFYRGEYNWLANLAVKQASPGLSGKGARPDSYKTIKKKRTHHFD